MTATSVVECSRHEVGDLDYGRKMGWKKFLRSSRELCLTTSGKCWLLERYGFGELNNTRNVVWVWKRGNSVVMGDVSATLTLPVNLALQPRRRPVCWMSQILRAVTRKAMSEFDSLWSNWWGVCPSSYSTYRSCLSILAGNLQQRSFVALISSEQ